MEIDIEKELTGKNPARVAPQVRIQVKKQKQRVLVHITMTLSCLILIVLGLMSEWIPVWIQAISYLSLPFTILGFYGDSHLLRYQKKKLVLIEEILQSR